MSTASAGNRGEGQQGSRTTLASKPSGSTEALLAHKPGYHLIAEPGSRTSPQLFRTHGSRRAVGPSSRAPALKKQLSSPQGGYRPLSAHDEPRSSNEGAHPRPGSAPHQPMHLAPLPVDHRVGRGTTLELRSSRSVSPPASTSALVATALGRSMSGSGVPMRPVSGGRGVPGSATSSVLPSLSAAPLTATAPCSVKPNPSRGGRTIRRLLSYGPMPPPGSIVPFASTASSLTHTPSPGPLSSAKRSGCLTADPPSLASLSPRVACAPSPSSSGGRQRPGTPTPGVISGGRLDNAAAPSISGSSAAAAATAREQVTAVHRQQPASTGSTGRQQQRNQARQLPEPDPPSSVETSHSDPLVKPGGPLRQLTIEIPHRSSVDLGASGKGNAISSPSRMPSVGEILPAVASPRIIGQLGHSLGGSSPGPFLPPCHSSTEAMRQLLEASSGLAADLGADHQWLSTLLSSGGTQRSMQ